LLHDGHSQRSPPDQSPPPARGPADRKPQLLHERAPPRGDGQPARHFGGELGLHLRVELTEAELRGQFAGLADAVLGSERARRLADAVLAIDGTAEIASLVRAAAPMPARLAGE
jgi:hypothetical protein